MVARLLVQCMEMHIWDTFFRSGRVLGENLNELENLAKLDAGILVIHG